ncbi:MAG: hypothetical protein K6B52_03160, partial [Clostridiales bacterium]|nr:hypothetical protein [Clostridiales bacterium]
ITVNNGAVVKGDSGIEVRAGSLTVNGGTITATAESYSYTANGSGTTTRGAAIAIAQHTTALSVNATLNGGTLVGTEKIGVTDVNSNMSNVAVVATESFTQNSSIPAGYKWVETETAGKYELVAEPFAIHVHGASLVTEGKIIIRFGVTVPEGSNAEKITMSLNGRSRTVSVNSPDTVISGYGYAAFDFAVYANEMDGVVQLTVEDAEGNALKIQRNDLSVVDVYEYSVNTYIENQTNNQGAAQKLKNFVAVMKTYGEYSKYYFENRTAEISLDDTTPEAPDDNILNDFIAEKHYDGGYSGPQYAGGSLALVDGTSIMVYFTGDVEGCTFTCEGNELTPVKNGSYYYVLIDNVAARNLDKMYTITVSDGYGNTHTVTYSAMTYVRTVLNSETTSRSLKDVCIKLYDYAVAANAFFGND